MNEKLEALNQEIEKTEKKLRRAQHEEKILEHQIKTLTRKERTHRLCTRAAMLESYPIITGEATLPLRWLPPATPLWTCRPETPCAASCFRSASLQFIYSHKCLVIV